MQITLRGKSFVCAREPGKAPRTREIVFERFKKIKIGMCEESGKTIVICIWKKFPITSRVYDPLVPRLENRVPNTRTIVTV